MADKLIAWIQQGTLDDAEAYLREHEAELLTDNAAAVMQMLIQANPQNPGLRDHQNRLARAREAGIAALYAEIRQQRRLEKIGDFLQQQGPIGDAVWRFVQADDAAAAALLQTEAAALLHADAGNLLRQLAAALPSPSGRGTGGEGEGADFAARVTARLAQQQSAYQARAGGPLRPAPAEPEAQHPQPQDWQDHAERQPVQAERGTTYTVIHANYSAIGDHAQTINYIERLPLEWKRPTEGRARLAAAAVGRETELAELHGRLTTLQGAAVVSRGTSAALRGQPAIGKTTLAAMYADRYGDRYPGGVLWLEVGPDRRTADRVTPILQRIATYAYAADAQAQTLLENAVFAVDAVQALLSGHGPMLVVIDDVWDPAALCELVDALPDDACKLLTTRDYDVAYALENSPAAIQALDVLSPPDARLLLQTGAPGLPDDLADDIAKKLGYHAQALTLAAGALASRKAHHYAKTAAELLARVAAGQGFGDLPRLDKTEQVTEVEIALKYSYDYLGERGPHFPAWFRALGVFAPETDFAAAAATFVWDVDARAAEEFLVLLDGLSLLRETTVGRWQQHAILRAYARSLQTAAERTQFPERHADYYLNLSQTCYECKPRDDQRVEQEFAQIQHAFAWCEENSPRRATRLALLLNDFMRNRGRVPQLQQWLQTAMTGAELHGARLGRANTLQSLGDLESRLGNVAQARAHYDAALPLYEAEQAPVGLMNTWISLARLEAGLGNVAEADRYYQQVFRVAEQIGFGDHPVTRDLRQEYGQFKAAQMGQSSAPDIGEAAALQALADRLVAWIQTPDWDASAAYLQAHADLLTDEAETALELLRQANPNANAIPQHQTLLRRCREVGIEAAYRELRVAMAAAQQAAHDPFAVALDALLAVDSIEALEHTLAQHPILAELAALERLGVEIPALVNADPNMARRLLALLGVLLDNYNHTHAEHVDPAEHARFVALHEAALSVAEPLDENLAAGLRDSLGWALNTQGNAHAEHDDHTAAVEAYTRALVHTPENAMLYRNRAGEYLELRQWVQAESDIAQAAALEPDAPRLVELREALAGRDA